MFRQAQQSCILDMLKNMVRAKLSIFCSEVTSLFWCVLTTFWQSLSLYRVTTLIPACLKTFAPLITRDHEQLFLITRENFCQRTVQVSVGVVFRKHDFLWLNLYDVKKKQLCLSLLLWSRNTLFNLPYFFNIFNKQLWWRMAYWELSPPKSRYINVACPFDLSTICASW